MSTNRAFETRIRAIDEEAITQAAALILAGQCVAVPTETVYGLAADATNGEAVARIYATKGRPTFNPLIVHIASLDAAQRLVQFSPQAIDLAARFWPGPLTMVLPARAENGIAPLVSAGLPTLAIRMPAHPVMRDVLTVCDRPLAAPSANASGRISPTCAAHVQASLDGRVPLILDAGPCAVGLESTIIGFKEDGNPVLLRPGPLDLGLVLASAETITAPGQLGSHYAPSKPLRLVATTATEDEYFIGFGDVAGVINLSAQGDMIEAAARLFAALHEADASPQPRIAIAPVPDVGLGQAINDRLKRAAA